MNECNPDLADWLQTILIFRGFSRSQVLSLCQIVQPQTWQKDELIFKQGSPATGFFVVKTGRVKVFKVSPMGKEQILNIFEPGDNFAEVGALDGQPFPASAAALERVELIFFPRQVFLELLRQDPDIAINMLISLSQHSRHLVSVIEDLSFKDVPQRLAGYLLNLSDASSQKSSDRTQFINLVTLDITKTQLAAALGTIPATLSRAFYRLSSEGIIAVNGSQIEVLDRDRLQHLSQSLGQSDL
ncbi:Crp/Fnr family transcriptional regulator [Tychonema sp. LEGE 07203]|uniref:Crp/Fnr family transcriptional regulator n=1 Tax=Tychonema sp. LEGE 07203 TaxID=1828671 RepID=UPI0018819EF9|nr:Crp/Fnr family transcriptional regulator [Tychonema sp. LEGE 07203]MBE9094090.1 Crp/Fnr family transcriptional regulator [Tychonema sp. LEGE 07203]